MREDAYHEVGRVFLAGIDRLVSAVVCPQLIAGRKMHAQPREEIKDKTKTHPRLFHQPLRRSVRGTVEGHIRFSVQRTPRLGGWISAPLETVIERGGCSPVGERCEVKPEVAGGEVDDRRGIGGATFVYCRPGGRRTLVSASDPRGGDVVRVPCWVDSLRVSMGAACAREDDDDDRSSELRLLGGGGTTSGAAAAGPCA